MNLVEHQSLANHSDSSFTILALHGFLGEGVDFAFLTKSFPKVNILAPNLIGSGEAKKDITTKVDFNLLIADLLTYIEKYIKKDLVILGYSFGARLALMLVPQLKNQPKVLILESPHLGFTNLSEAEARATNDHEKAKAFKADYESFLNSWYSLGIFQNLNSEDLIKKALKYNSYNQSLFLSSLSPGVMPDLRPIVSSLDCNTMLITGEGDLKFTAYGEEVKRLNSKILHRPIESSAHNVHLENEQEFQLALKEFVLS